MDWVVQNHVVGSWAIRDGLHWVRYREASHMVMLEEPAAAHDMVLRFLGIDVLNAAGPAAVIPSRLGTNGSELVINRVDAEGGSKALTPTPSTTLDAEREQKIQHQDREAYYGPRRFGVLIVVLLSIVGLAWMLFRWLSRRRQRSFRLRARQKTARKGKARMRSSIESNKWRSKHDSVELEALVSGQNQNIS